MKVLVTGGSSDISRAVIVRRLALGDEVVFTSSTPESLAETTAHFAGKAAGMLFRLADPEASESEFVRAASSGFDAVVFCAAEKQPSLKPFADFGFPAFRDYLRANVEGNAWLAHRVLPGMVERKFGRLVFISSLSAAIGTSRYPAYCTAKSAIEGLFLNLAVDYGEHGILSNVVRPGVIATKRNDKLWKRTGYDKRVQELIPVREIGKPDQVASVVDLALERDSYLNGAVIPVGGGMPSMRSAGLLK